MVVGRSMEDWIHTTQKTETCLRRGLLPAMPFNDTALLMGVLKKCGEVDEINVMSLGAVDLQ
jgi:hypothetical protein